MDTAGKRHGLTTPLEGTDARHWDRNAPIAAPLCLIEPPVRHEWVDYNGHMSESCFLLVFGDNSDAFFRYIGIDEVYRAAGQSFYTVQTHLHYLREVAEGEPLRLTLQLLDLDEKRMHIFHAMHHGRSADLLATGEQMLLHEVRIGMIPDSGGVLRLPRRLPRAIATEMLMTGRRMGAAEAQRRGLVNSVVPEAELMQAANALARQIAQAAPLSLAAIKEVLRATESQSVQAAYQILRGADLPSYRRMLASDDALEGPRAFAEKRAPVWRGN